MKKIRKQVFDWMNERIEFDGIISFMEKKYVPIHNHSVWYYFGGVSLFLFIIQVISGILLLFYYKGSSDLAFESIQFIMAKVEFGWLVRSVHVWSANLFILSMFIHMFSVFFGRAYRKPREITWVTGVLLLFLGLAFGFSGYLLPWNKLAFFATKVGTDITSAVPLIGDFLKTFLRGSEDVTGATLSRFFGFHVALFPGIFTFLLILHLLLVQKQGMSEPLDVALNTDEPKRKMPFFPNFVLRDLLLWLLVLNLIAILAVLFPAELGEKADAFASAPAGIKPEWYFLFMFEILKFLPPNILFIEGETFGVLMFMILGALWLIIPFIDKKSAEGKRNVKLTYIGIAVIIVIILLTVYGWIT